MNGAIQVHGELEVRGKRRGVVIVTYRAAFVIVLGVVLALVVGFAKIESVQHDYVRKIAAVQCDTGNDARALDLAAWLKLDKLIGHHDDPRAATFLNFVRAKDAQRVFDGTTCAVPKTTPSSSTVPTTKG